MKRGEVWTVAAKGDLSKPRPAVIVQAKRLDESTTAFICPLTSVEAGGFLPINPTRANGLLAPSAPMAWKAAAIKKERLGKAIGELSVDEMRIVEDAMREVLGLQ